jgi:hypothetical protein
VSSNPNAARRQHAHTRPQPPELPEPSYAERVRTLISLSTIGTLSTFSRKHEGFPFGSLMPYAVDPAGRPVLLISSMAMHTQNLLADPRASLFVAQSAADIDPLGAARATLIGRTKPVSASELSSVREVYIATHESSKYWVDFTDFSFFRLELTDIYYVGGFGVMGWVEARDYQQASPDPLATASPAIIAHMNADHIDAMILLARTHAAIEATDAAMTAVDRLGFHLRLTTAEGMKGVRINYPSEVRTPQQTRSVLVEMVRQAKG